MSDTKDIIQRCHRALIKKDEEIARLKEKLTALGGEAVIKFPTPYEAGFDCGKNGATQGNCHFAFFSSRKSSDEWQRGRRAWEAQKENP